MFSALFCCCYNFNLATSNIVLHNCLVCQNKRQAEAEVVPSSRSAEVKVKVGVEVEVEVEVRVEVFGL